MKKIIFIIALLISSTVQSQMIVNANGGSYTFSNTSIPSGNTVTGATTKTYFTTSANITTDMWVAGKTIVVEAYGVYSVSGIVLSLTASLDFITGGTPTVIISNTVPANLGIGSNQYWEGKIKINIISISGTTATVDIQGALKFISATGSCVWTPMNTTSTSTISISSLWAVQLGTNWATTTTNSIQLRGFQIYQQ